MTEKKKKFPYSVKAKTYTTPFSFNMIRLRPCDPSDKITIEITRDTVTVRPSGATKTVSADSVTGHLNDIQDRVAVQGPIAQVKRVLNTATLLLKKQGATTFLKDTVDGLRAENAAQEDKQ